MPNEQELMQTVIDIARLPIFLTALLAAATSWVGIYMGLGEDGVATMGGKVYPVLFGLLPLGLYLSSRWWNSLMNGVLSPKDSVVVTVFAGFIAGLAGMLFFHIVMLTINVTFGDLDWAILQPLLYRAIGWPTMLSLGIVSTASGFLTSISLRRSVKKNQ